ncbi:hypothetical protein ATKI12_3714 [Kitasatospora sp. Ki12]
MRMGRDRRWHGGAGRNDRPAEPTVEVTMTDRTGGATLLAAAAAAVFAVVSLAAAARACRCRVEGGTSRGGHGGGGRRRRPSTGHSSGRPTHKCPNPPNCN